MKDDRTSRDLTMLLTELGILEREVNFTTAKMQKLTDVAATLSIPGPALHIIRHARNVLEDGLAEMHDLQDMLREAYARAEGEVA